MRDCREYRCLRYINHVKKADELVANLSNKIKENHVLCTLDSVRSCMAWYRYFNHYRVFSSSADELVFLLFFLSLSAYELGEAMMSGDVVTMLWLTSQSKYSWSMAAFQRDFFLSTLCIFNIHIARATYSYTAEAIMTCSSHDPSFPTHLQHNSQPPRDIAAWLTLSVLQKQVSTHIVCHAIAVPHSKWIT